MQLKWRLVRQVFLHITFHVSQSRLSRASSGPLFSVFLDFRSRMSDRIKIRKVSAKMSAASRLKIAVCSSIFPQFSRLPAYPLVAALLYSGYTLTATTTIQPSPLTSTHQSSRCSLSFSFLASVSLFVAFSLVDYKAIKWPTMRREKFYNQAQTSQPYRNDA